MDFADSKILLFLWLIPLCLFLITLELRQVRQRFTAFAKLRIEELLTNVWSARRTVCKSLLLVASLLFMILALARPRWDFEWKDLPRGGTDIMIALDLSTSMLATDIPPNRLERAKREIIDLLGILKGDRIGIVAFAGVSFVYSPLTVDYRLADMFIKQLNIKLMPVQGTVIGEALNQSIDALEKASSSDTQGKAIILITDGEDQGTDALLAAKKAKEKGIRIFAVGIGSEAGAPIPLADGGFKKDQAGNIVVSKLDEKTLQDIAAETGGAYVRSSSGSLDLDLIYQNIRGSGKDHEGDVTRQKIWHERFQIFLALALFFLLLEFFLRGSRSKKSRRTWWGTAVLLLGLLPYSSPKAVASDRSEGEKAFQEKDYKTAAEKFLNAEIREPTNLQNAYNRAVSQFYNHQYKEAAQGFAKAAQAQDKTLAQRSYYNLGNSLVAQGALEDGVKAFEQALAINPQDKEAQDNLEWTKKKIQEQKQQQQNKKDNDKKDDKSDDKQDQNKDQGKDQKQDSKNDKQQEQKQDDKKQDQDKAQNQDQKKDSKEDKAQDSKQDSKEAKNDAQQDKEKQQDSASADKKKDAMDNKGGSADKAPNDGKDLSREEAEKLLRMMEDQEQVYGMPPQYKAPQTAPERDW